MARVIDSMQLEGDITSADKYVNADSKTKETSAYNVK